MFLRDIGEDRMEKELKTGSVFALLILIEGETRLFPTFSLVRSGIEKLH
jgi:hypothetical protein